MQHYMVLCNCPVRVENKQLIIFSLRPGALKHMFVPFSFHVRINKLKPEKKRNKL